MRQGSEFQILVESSVISGFILGVLITAPLVAAETGHGWIYMAAISMGLAGIWALTRNLTRLRDNHASG